MSKSKESAELELSYDGDGYKYYLKKETRKGLWVKPFR